VGVLGILSNRRQRGRLAGRRIDWTVVLACFVLTAGAAVLVGGVLAGVTGDERAGLPEAIESVNPVPEAVQTLSQSSVFVDLRPEHYGRLTIDGIEIETVNIDDVVRGPATPGSQVDLPKVTIYEPGNATLTFTPSAGAPIERFTTGRHTVKLTYWPLIDGPTAARTYTWTFDVI